MTTPSNPTSPFQSNTPDTAKDNQEHFSFRTMQDDLSVVKKNDVLITKESPIVSSIKQELIANQTVSTIKTPSKLPQGETASTNPNPFLEQAVTEIPVSPKKEDLPVVNKAMPETKIVEVQLPKTTTSQSNISTYKIIVIITILLVAGIIGLSGYYFWLTQSSQKEEIVVEPTIEIPTTIEEPVVIVNPLEKYSSEKPNYLVVGAENMSAANIQTTLLSVTNDLKNSSAQTLYEFMVVDANNNPIPLPVFAAAADLKLSQKIITALGSDFTLFAYNDNGNIRIGFSAPIQNKELLTKEMQLQEKTLPQDISFMFLNSVPEITTGIFKDGSYNSYKTRYFNVDTQSTFSVDYVVTDSKLIIGTSKNSLRAIIDKQLLKTNSQEQSTENNSEAYVGNVANPALTETEPVQVEPLLSE